MRLFFSVGRGHGCCGFVVGVLAGVVVREFV